MAGIGNHPYLIHYVLNEGRSAGECRPAAVVRDWGGCHNLQVFLDGTGDGFGDEATLIRTSVAPSQTATPGTWHRAAECETATAAQAAAVKASEEATQAPAPEVPVDPTPPAADGSASAETSGASTASGPAATGSTSPTASGGTEDAPPGTFAPVLNPVGMPTVDGDPT